MSAQINSRYSESVKRGPDLLWAWTQALLSWSSYSGTKFFCQMRALWTFCSPVEAPYYWLLPTSGCPQKIVVPILYVLLWSLLLFLDQDNLLPLWGLKKSLPGQEMELGANWSSRIYVLVPGECSGPPGTTARCFTQIQ